MDVLGVDHVDLTVKDVARSTAFYDTVLGSSAFAASRLARARRELGERP
jgi:catechol-2,3-dioxygenase